MIQRNSPAQIARIFAMAVLLSTLGTGALWPAEPMEGPGNPNKGRDLFVNKGCMRCHSIFKESGKKGPNLASVGMGRNLYELCASVWTHWSRMNTMLEQETAARLTLTPSDFRDIIAYLYYLNYRGAPGQADKGKLIFSTKGCIQCHAIEPLNAKAKPARAVYEMHEFQDPVTLAVAVWNHGTGMYATMSQRNMRWPEFEEEEVTHLVGFIREQTGSPTRSTMMLSGDPARGGALFSAKACADCHKPGSRGSHEGVDLASSGRAASLCALVASLWNHYPRMSQTIRAKGIGVPRIDRQEMEDLMAYVYWLKAYGLKGDAAAGRELYFSKKCVSCHSRTDGKAPAAPSLVRSDTAASAYSLLAAIWNHGPKMELALRERKISWPALNGEEMRHLIAFFRLGKPEDQENKH